MVDYGPPPTPLYSAANNYTQFPFLHTLWFENITANNLHLNVSAKANIKSTFMGENGGGWYEYPFNDKMSILCVNSIYWGTDTFKFFENNKYEGHPINMSESNRPPQK